MLPGVPSSTLAQPGTLYCRSTFPKNTRKKFLTRCRAAHLKLHRTKPLASGLLAGLKFPHHPSTQCDPSGKVTCRASTNNDNLREKIVRLGKRFNASGGTHVVQLFASIGFVVLYVWGTYSTPEPGSWRYGLDAALCAFFALDYGLRLMEAENKLQAAFSIGNIIDLFSFLPSLIETFVGVYSVQLISLSWVRIFRAMRVLRLSVITRNLSDIRHLSSSAVVDGALRVKVSQLFAAIVVVVFTAASVIQLFEKIPWHLALYFVVTTLTTVGYGDVVVKTTVGRISVVAMMILAVVVIPARVTQMFREATSQRITRGTLPRTRTPFVLAITNVSDVRGFSDFFTEFSTHLKTRILSSNRHTNKIRMVCLTGEPSFELQVLQELHEKSLTLVEGSAFSESDLVRCQAHNAQMLLLLADRFNAEQEEEDLKILFEAWAVKSYTKSVPLFVQVLRSSSVPRISQFLDPAQDIIISLEQVRQRLLVISCLCPGSGTLLGNLFRIARVSKENSQENVMGGRQWRRAYVSSCANGVFKAKAAASLSNMEFQKVAEALFRVKGIMLIGIVDENGKMRMNPGKRHIRMTDNLIIIAESKQAINEVENVKTASLFQEAPSMNGSSSDSEETVEGSRDVKNLSENSGPSQEQFVSEDEIFDDVAVKELARHEEDQEMVVVVEEEEDISLHEHQWRQELSPLRSGSYDSAEEMVVKGSEVESQESSQLQVEVDLSLSDVRGHVILSGCPDSFLGFVKELRRCSAQLLPVIVLHEDESDPGVQSVLCLSCVFFINGSPTNRAGLTAAKASEARCIVHLCPLQRPNVSSKPEKTVLADAQALLTSYCVGGEDIPAVVELCFTSSINFLLPGMLLKGGVVVDDEMDLVKLPRKSWEFRKVQMRVAREEGLAEWQSNPYYCAGRVLVPALLDTLACHSVFNKGLLIDLMAGLTGDVDSTHIGGPLLTQIPLPMGFETKKYTQLVSYLILERGLIPLGLYRKKNENRGWVLRYVEVSPGGNTNLDADDLVYVLKQPVKIQQDGNRV